MPDFFAFHLLLDQLDTEGVQFLFGTTRSNQSPLSTLVAHQYKPIEYIETLHENIACTIGMGYAQASGKPAVISLPSGPGFINGLSGIYNAAQARVPLVILSEQPDNDTLNDEPPLSADVLSIASSLCKWSCQLNSVSEIPRVIRRSFHESLSAPKGPVVVSLPMNLLTVATSPRAVAVPHLSPLGTADSHFLKKAAQHLVEARLPCIIAGNEVSHYRARSEVVALAEVLGCPVFIEPLPTGVNFPNRHTLFASVLPHAAARASAMLKPFDVVLVLGMHTRPTARPFEPPFLHPTSRVIQINIEPGLHGRSLPNDLSATADIKESVSRLRSEIQLTGTATWINSATQRAERTKKVIGGTKAAYQDSLPYPDHAGKISLAWLLRMLEAIRPNKSVIVNDLIAAEPHVMESLILEHSFAYFASNSGALGYAPAASLGIEIASPESTIICLTDDQSALAYPQVFWTAAWNDSSVKFIVVNEQGSSMFNIRLNGSPDQAHEGLRNRPVSFEDLARSMGVPYFFAQDMGTLESSLKTIFEAQGPQIIEVRLE